jgi:hypothetical protein
MDTKSSANSLMFTVIESLESVTLTALTQICKEMEVIIG